MADGQRVLLVDGLSETEEVLKAVLEPRGLRVDRVRGHAPAAGADGETRPEVVVLHAHQFDGEMTTVPGWEGVPRVVIGRIEPAGDAAPAGSPGDEERLEHPFQYADLIRSIERLLQRPAA